jgi:hypothetical protein
MVRQGQHAGVSAQKKARRFSVKQQGNAGQIVSKTKLTEFVLVRYQLVYGNKKPALVLETVRRFLAVLIDAAPQAGVWDLGKIVKLALANTGDQVPWQFYVIIAHEWTTLERFLLKELPAVPLAERIIVSNDSWSMSDVIAAQLGAGWFINTYGAGSERLSQVTEQQLTTLTQSFTTEEGVNWQNVKQLYATVAINIPQNVDNNTKLWFEQLQHIEV